MKVNCNRLMCVILELADTKQIKNLSDTLSERLFLQSRLSGLTYFHVFVGVLHQQGQGTSNQAIA
jgi:hypothetical protein